MLIESIRVQNFRSILNETLSFDALTALVGPNGVGKSNFLRALVLFYSPSARIDIEDFYDSDTTTEIVVSITFAALSKEAAEFFGSYLQGDKLTVERVFNFNSGKPTATYHGASLQNPEFQGIREGLSVKDRGKTAKPKYDAIRARSEYGELPEWSKLKLVDVEPALTKWEADHSAVCKRQRDDGRFFGFTEVGRGYLGRFTRFLFIPAVRDASADAAEGRGSVLTDLMDMVVRSIVANKESVKKLKEETQTRYEEIMRPENLEELNGLAGQLSKTLQSFVPNASVDLRWLPLDQIKIEMPKADVKLVEDRYATAVNRTGHGLQRAFILTMLQHLAMAQSVNAGKPKDTMEATQSSEPKPEDKGTLPNLVLAIEEPELYQHPNRQRHLAKIFLQLASGMTPGVAEKTQVIYATHSPLFVGLDRFNQIRLLRKYDNGAGKPRITNVVETTLDKVAEKVWEADGSKGDKYTGATLINRLHSIITPLVNEGFFADTVVLVEGEDDYAAVIGVGRAMDKELDSLGVSVIPVNGKRSMDRPAIIFQEFGIPVYLLWDSDGKKGETAGTCATCGKSLDGKPDPCDNHRLLRIVGKSQEDWPEHLEKNHCCFKYDLEYTLKAEIGDTLFEKLLSDCQSDFSIPKRKHAIKSPAVIAAIIERAQKEGSTSSTLQTVIGNILALTGALDDKKATT
ncbi:MAG: ATP-dependent endonuclease [Pseudomonadota bacterium]